MSWFGMASRLLAGSRPSGQSPEYPLLSSTVIEPPCLGCETLIPPEAVELGLALPPPPLPPLLPPLLHAAAIIITVIPRPAVPNFPSLDPMAFTYSRRLRR